MPQNKKKSQRSRQKQVAKFKEIQAKSKPGKIAISKHESPKKGLFGSERLQSMHKKQSSNCEKIANSNKVITTDESNNCYESNVHQSVYYGENKEPNEQYFHSTALKSNKQSKEHLIKSSKNIHKMKASKDQFDQIKTLIKKQDQQIKTMKGDLSEKQLHRLIRMQSIQRLQAIQSIQSKAKSKKKTKF